jgi:hypothetical protein
MQVLDENVTFPEPLILEKVMVSPDKLPLAPETEASQLVLEVPIRVWSMHERSVVVELNPTPVATYPTSETPPGEYSIEETGMFPHICPAATVTAEAGAQVSPPVVKFIERYSREFAEFVSGAHTKAFPVLGRLLWGQLIA